MPGVQLALFATSNVNVLENRTEPFWAWQSQIQTSQLSCSIIADADSGGGL